MLRTGREMNAEHPRRKKFLVDLSQAIFSQHEGARQKLMEAREAANPSGPPTRTERVKYIRRVVGDPQSVTDRHDLYVLNAHREIDHQCHIQAEAAGMNVENLTVADVAYPLVTSRVMGVFQRQLVHVQNGCISDDPELPSEGSSWISPSPRSICCIHVLHTHYSAIVTEIRDILQQSRYL